MFKNIRDLLGRLSELSGDVARVFEEIFRVLKQNHYALLAPATKPDLTGYFHLTVENKDWWVCKCKEVGFSFVEFLGKDGIIFKK